MRFMRCAILDTSRQTVSLLSRVSTDSNSLSLLPEGFSMWRLIISATLGRSAIGTASPPFAPMHQAAHAGISFSGDIGCERP